MKGLFGSLRNIGMSAADTLDFIPGFDPIPEQQGAVRGMFGSLAPRGAAQTPPIVQSGMKAPQQVQPIQRRGMMAQPPGGVPMTGLERYSKPLTLPQLLTMSGDSRRAYNQGRDAHSAAQAQMQFDMQQARQERQHELQQDWAEKSAANVMRQSHIDALMGMGLDEHQATIYADDPEAFRDEYAKNYAPQSLSPNDEVFTFGNDANPLTNSNTDTVNEIDQQRADAATLSAEASMLGSQADMKRAKQDAETLDDPDIEGESKLRKEFDGITKDFRKVADAYARIEATDGTTPAGQMGLIFQYMKMLDPGSTVREGEYATAQNTTGVPGRVRNAYNSILEGKFLTPEQITDFETQAGNLFNRASGDYEARLGQYRGLAEQYGYDPARAVLDSRAASTSTPQQTEERFAPEAVQSLPEGTVVEDEAGQRFQIRNGQPVPVR